jgi:hypothetical protein
MQYYRETLTTKLFEKEDFHSNLKFKCMDSTCQLGITYEKMLVDYLLLTRISEFIKQINPNNTVPMITFDIYGIQDPQTIISMANNDKCNPAIYFNCRIFEIELYEHVQEILQLRKEKLDLFFEINLKMFFDFINSMIPTATFGMCIGERSRSNEHALNMLQITFHKIKSGEFRPTLETLTDGILQAFELLEKAKKNTGSNLLKDIDTLFLPNS